MHENQILQSIATDWKMQWVLQKHMNKYTRVEFSRHWGDLGVSECIWAYLGVSGSIWAHVRPFGRIQA